MKKIVCIDDCEIDLAMYSRVVDRSDIARIVNSFTDASLALEWFRERDCDDIDLIFLDINMPRMNGFEFLEKFKELNLLKTAVVYFLTSSENPSEMARAVSLGARFNNKPLTKQRFYELMNELFDLDSSRGA